MRTQQYHVPDKDPCTKCGLAAHQHRVDHKQDGDPCKLCNGLSTQHRTRERKTDLQRTTYFGIDGEGQGRQTHRYVLLAAASEDGERKWTIEPNPSIGRLTTRQCLDMILKLPTRRSKIFAFSFNYDLTKMLMDLDDASLFLLFRPELRAWPNIPANEKKRLSGPRPIKWNDYVLNLQGTKFVVEKGRKRVVIWDLFKFFQAKFVNALRDWKVGTPELWDRMQLMKDKRHIFDKEEMDAVKAYCLEECVCIAQLAKKLVEAHEGAGLKLRSYYGAGSSGAAMLTAMGIKDKLAPTPQPMAVATASAFFGGRFENSVIGPVPEALTNWDISSAYVYQLAFLPCLEHGSWHHTTKRKDLEKAQNQNGALIRYTLGPNPGISTWGPFPFRTKDGSISFPIESGGGWIWRDEYLQGEKLFPHVQFQEAWIYSTNCDCRPFAKIPEYYNLRLKIGKEGPGIVIKLGMNSCYGKLAQSVGTAIFNSWIWAGMITSGCRAQLLQLLGLHKDRSNCLMMATDGLLTRETIIPPAPLDTKTGATGKPLGGWEEKKAPKGMFIARPGIYFPLNPTIEEIASVRARGVGRSVVLESWQKIVDAWERDGVKGTATVANVSRFCGAKTSISISGSREEFTRAKGTGSMPSYGQWISRKVGLSFNPLPKRASVNPDGLTLALRTFPFDLMSVPYSRAISRMNQDAKELMAAYQEQIEQPDGELEDYEQG